MKVHEYNNKYIANHVNAWILKGDGISITRWFHNKDLSKRFEVYA